MQIKVKSVKVLKTGTNEFGEWKFVAVTTDEGVKYTTLAKDADVIQPGVSINISDMDENEKGKSFKKFEIVEGTAKTEPVKDKAVAGPEKPPFADTRELSIELQVIFKGVMENWEKELPEQLKAGAVNWALKKLYPGTTITTLIAPEKPFGKAQDKPVVKETVQPAKPEATLPVVASGAGTVNKDYVENILSTEIEELLKAVNWKPATWRSWIKSQFKIDVTGELSEVLARMNPNQVNMLVNHLNTMAEASGVK